MKWKWQGGNWSVFPKRKYNEWHVAIPADNANSMKIALFDDGVPGDTDEEREALARLIGSSPDMAKRIAALEAENAELRAQLTDPWRPVGEGLPEERRPVDISYYDTGKHRTRVSVAYYDSGWRYSQTAWPLPDWALVYAWKSRPEPAPYDPGKVK